MGNQSAAHNILSSVCSRRLACEMFQLGNFFFAFGFTGIMDTRVANALVVCTVEGSSLLVESHIITKTETEPCSYSDVMLLRIKIDSLCLI